MNWQAITFDWNQVRAFLATAEEGSLSAAARALGATQPTLSRQVAALEDALDVRLFERAGRTLVLTETGHMLLTHVRKMGEAAGGLALAVSGQAANLEGQVTITATDMTSAYVLPPILARLSRDAPGLEITVVAANEIRDLQRREADIALRNVAPVEPELIARRLRDDCAVFCAARTFLDEYGPIESLAALEAAPWVGYGDRAQMSEGLRAYGLNVAPERFRHNCATGVVQWEMIKHGMGVGVLTESYFNASPELVRLLPDQLSVPVPLYIISHGALRNSARMRAVWDALVEALG